jgi:hypothetical protein
MKQIIYLTNFTIEVILCVLFALFICGCDNPGGHWGDGDKYRDYEPPKCTCLTVKPPEVTATVSFTGTDGSEHNIDRKIDFEGWHDTPCFDVDDVVVYEIKTMHGDTTQYFYSFEKPKESNGTIIFQHVNDLDRLIFARFTQLEVIELNRTIRLTEEARNYEASARAAKINCRRHRVIK